MTGTDFQARPPKDCTDMAQLRGQIDRLDRALVTLMAERQGYIERAAELKAKRASVRDEARIQDVLAKVKACAKASGLDPAIAEAVWRVLIECSIALELKTFDRRSRSENP